MTNIPSNDLLWLDSLPFPSNKRIAVHVKPAAERALKQGHPWLFDGAIRKISHEGQAGDLAVIFDKERRFLAIGLYDPASPIRIKVLQHHQQATIDRDFFHACLQSAVDLREPLRQSTTNGYRLVHGENDGLPGLVVDRYGAVLVLKLYSAAWIPHLRDVIPALLDVQPASNLVLRLSRDLQQSGAHGLKDGQVLLGDLPPQPLTFTEGELTFTADVIHGHKTGFFFDQRENRERVGKLANGRRVLDVFAYVGAFSLYAASGGAESVLSLDISAPAMHAAQAHFTLNQHIPNVAQAKHDILIADAFVAMDQMRADRRMFDLIIVDPPSFAKRADEVDRALAAYASLVEHALPLLERDGIFVIASCSSRVTAEAFFRTVTSTAAKMGRVLSEIERTGHALDHPIGFPEGAYLKCLFARG
ncbi:MAG: class I SAM-dependent rRNA methyltransferase [Aggregatilineales bacterium]